MKLFNIALITTGIVLVAATGNAQQLRVVDCISPTGEVMQCMAPEAAHMTKAKAILAGQDENDALASGTSKPSGPSSPPPVPEGLGFSSGS